MRAAGRDHGRRRRADRRLHGPGRRRDPLGDGVRRCRAARRSSVIGALVFVMTGFGLGLGERRGRLLALPAAQRLGRGVFGWTTFGGAIGPVILVVFGLLLAGSSKSCPTRSRADPIGALADAAADLVPRAVRDRRRARPGRRRGAGHLLLRPRAADARAADAALRRRRCVDGVIMVAGTVYVVFFADNFLGQFQGFLITLGVPIAAWCGVMLADVAAAPRRLRRAPSCSTRAAATATCAWLAARAGRRRHGRSAGAWSPTRRRLAGLAGLPARPARPGRQGRRVGVRQPRRAGRAGVGFLGTLLSSTRRGPRPGGAQPRAEPRGVSDGRRPGRHRHAARLRRPGEPLGGAALRRDRADGRRRWSRVRRRVAFTRFVAPAEPVGRLARLLRAVAVRAAAAGRAALRRWCPAGAGRRPDRRRADVRQVGRRSWPRGRRGDAGAGRGVHGLLRAVHRAGRGRRRGAGAGRRATPAPGVDEASHRKALDVLALYAPLRRSRFVTSADVRRTGPARRSVIGMGTYDPARVLLRRPRADPGRPARDRRVPRRVGRPARPRRGPPRRRRARRADAAGAPVGLHRGQADPARGPAHDGTPVVDVDRGGLITWHGPGQLVGYPIVALATPLDVVDFVRRLEEALIAVVHRPGRAGRRAGRRAQRGVAARRRPRARAQGRRDRRARAGRGHAARVRAQLRPRPHRVRPHRALGITDAGVTSLAVELGRHVPVRRAAGAEAAEDGRLPVADTRSTGRGPAGLDLRLHPSRATPGPLRRLNDQTEAPLVLIHSASHTVPRRGIRAKPWAMARPPSWRGASPPPTASVGRGSAQLRRHLRGDQLDLVEVGQVQQLQVDAGDRRSSPATARAGRPPRPRCRPARSPACPAASLPIVSARRADLRVVAPDRDRAGRPSAPARPGRARSPGTPRPRARTARRPRRSATKGTLNSVGEPGRERGRAASRPAADDHRRVRLLHRLGQRGRVGERVVRAR